MNRKKAIVTGAALGMGRGICAVLAEEGYDIAFSYYPGTENVEEAIKTTVQIHQGRIQMNFVEKVENYRKSLGLPKHCSTVFIQTAFSFLAGSHSKR